MPIMKMAYPFLGSKKPLNNIPGGRAAGKSPSQFDPKELRKGIKIEHEHTPSSRKAEEISMDHLTEDKNYYKKLIKMEKKGMLLEKLAVDKEAIFLRPMLGAGYNAANRITKAVRGKGLGPRFSHPMFRAASQDAGFIDQAAKRLVTAPFEGAKLTAQSAMPAIRSAGAKIKGAVGNLASRIKPVAQDVGQTLQPSMWSR
jgi:hypothetical protein